jgi:predicted secreted protein
MSGFEPSSGAGKQSVAGLRGSAMALAISLAAGAALAQPRAEVSPEGVLQLQASATAEVPQDVMSVALSTTRDGPDANSVQTALKQALEAALAEARRAAKPGQLEVRTGPFALYPRHGSKGSITGWQGSAELVIEGRDMAGIAQLAGRIQTLTVARVGYGLSRELREKTEADVAAQAIAKYRAQAAQYARLFGYAGYALREVQVQTEGHVPPAMPMVRARAMAVDSAEAALPTEAGKSSVTASVSGSVQMQK